MTAELRQYMDERFDRLEATSLIGVKNTLTVEEAAIYTGYSVKGIYTLTSQKRIPHYKKNGKLYFDKQELDGWMTENRVKTEAEINSKATTYTVTHKKKRL
ncbi:MAG: helix-turn-helix domain-containing protein [Muribaculaceae bacterium]|nr:helix-turn-helix domain-containing protein [Muribaculaceae bacterium]